MSFFTQDMEMKVETQGKLDKTGAKIILNPPQKYLKLLV